VMIVCGALGALDLGLLAALFLVQPGPHR
jgi:hypothetical protein